MRSFQGGEWSEIVPIAETPLYEAHVSLLYDNQDRLWAAWNESGMNWGKDTGYVLNEEGTRLYEYRLLRVAVRDGSGWKVPAGDINEQLPEDYEPRYDDFPQLAQDADGRVWVFARQRLQRRRDTQSETPLHRAAWDIWGSTLDGGELDRADPCSLQPGPPGRALGAWPPTDAATSSPPGTMDNRDFEDCLLPARRCLRRKLPALERQTAAPRW